MAPFVDPKDRRPRERLLEAVLEVSGELGYEQIAVKHVIERAEASRGTFYNHFSDKEDCFAQAYVEASDWLYRRLRGIAQRQPSWRDGLRVGLAELLEFCANRPETAKALFIEAHAAGGEALAQHDRLMERLARGIDSAREAGGVSDGNGVSQGSPPAVTSSFMVGAIEALITAKLANGEAAKVPELLPGILHFAVMQYRGKEEAWEEMTSAPLATWEARRRVASEVP
jgi:AcrR family transcriptional regulator